MGKIRTTISWCRQADTLQLSVSDGPQGFRDAAAFVQQSERRWWSLGKRGEAEGEVGSSP